jgi:hypothetical protein
MSDPPPPPPATTITSIEEPLDEFPASIDKSKELFSEALATPNVEEPSDFK